ncbi:MAG TPA: hypothetical protein DD490_12875 [Acidobacteria bacterium]|nr:hypothetical protein [Acidobacteriota bacterium]
MIAPRLGVAFVMRPRGGVEAIDLASGAVRWHSDQAAKPLALTGDRLIAQVDNAGANALDLAVLDARSGASRDSLRMPLPEGVRASVTDTLDGTFRLQARGTGTELMVAWEATATATQGYLPAEDEIQSPSVVAGSAVLDLSTPRLLLKAEPAVRQVRSASLSRASLEEVSSRVVAGGQGRQLLAADGRHVLVTEPAKGAKNPLERHRWTIYDRSGARLGSVPAMVSATPFLVVGSTLYHVAPAHAFLRDGKLVERPAALRAVNLTTGKETWTKAAGATTFAGPFPP